MTVLNVSAFSQSGPLGDGSLLPDLPVIRDYPPPTPWYSNVKQGTSPVTIVTVYFNLPRPPSVQIFTMVGLPICPYL